LEILPWVHSFWLVGMESGQEKLNCYSVQLKWIFSSDLKLAAAKMACLIWRVFVLARLSCNGSQRFFHQHGIKRSCGEYVTQRSVWCSTRIWLKRLAYKDKPDWGISKRLQKYTQDMPTSRIERCQKDSQTWVDRFLNHDFGKVVFPEIVDTISWLTKSLISRVRRVLPTNL